MKKREKHEEIRWKVMQILMRLEKRIECIFLAMDL